MTRAAQSSLIALFCSLAQVAQSVEQRTENPRVDGSIPPLGTMNSKGSDLTGAFFISAAGLSLAGAVFSFIYFLMFFYYPHLFHFMVFYGFSY